MATAEPPREYPQRHRAYVPARALNSDYPVRESTFTKSKQSTDRPVYSSSTRTRMSHPSMSPQVYMRLLRRPWTTRLTYNSHFRRVIGYSRASDWGYAAGLTGFGIGAFELIERASPSEVNRAGLAGPRRLMAVVSLTAGFLLAYSKSQSTFCALPNSYTHRADRADRLPSRSGTGIYGQSRNVHGTADV